MKLSRHLHLKEQVSQRACEQKEEGNYYIIESNLLSNTCPNKYLHLKK